MLKARKITVELGGKTILSGIDFKVEEGQLVGILGPSGSGKSTLLMSLNGFRTPKEGVVTFQGKILKDHFEELKSDIGFVPQDDIVPIALKVERVLQYAAELRIPEEPAEVRERRVQGVIRSLELTDHKNLRVSKLSGGQRKRVSIGVELLSRPKLLFADEPTSGLDPALERSLTQTFRKLCDDGHAVVVTTHIMSSLNLYDRLAVIVGGRLAYFGPPDQIKSYFGVEDFSEIYTKLADHGPDEWQGRFRKSDLIKYLK